MPFPSDVNSPGECRVFTPHGIALRGTTLRPQELFAVIGWKTRAVNARAMLFVRRAPARGSDDLPGMILWGISRVLR